jgi:hypothetical protein
MLKPFVLTRAALSSPVKSGSVVSWQPAASNPKATNEPPRIGLRTARNVAVSPERMVADWMCSDHAMKLRLHISPIFLPVLPLRQRIGRALQQDEPLRDAAMAIELPVVAL